MFLLNVLAQAQCVREGIYFGLGVGDSIDHSHSKVEDRISLLANEGSQSKNHALGAVFFGYGYTVCNYMYYAFELGSYFPQRSITISDSGILSTNRLTQQDYITSDVLVGFRLTNYFLFYMRGGSSYAAVKFYHKETDAGNLLDLHAKRTGLAGRIGAGINYLITQHIGVGLDFIYTAYPKLNRDVSFLNLEGSSRANYIGLSTICSF